MGFYQKIRNYVNAIWMGLKDLQNKEKIKYNVSFLSLSLFPCIQNSPKLGRQEHLHPHCFRIIKIICMVAVNVMCFTVFSSDVLETSLVAVNGFKQSYPP